MVFPGFGGREDAVGVGLGVDVALGLGNGVDVALGVTVRFTVTVGVGVGVGLGAEVGVGLMVGVGVGLGAGVGVGLMVGVGVGLGARVGVDVGDGVGDGTISSTQWKRSMSQDCEESQGSSGLQHRWPRAQQTELKQLPLVQSSLDEHRAPTPRVVMARDESIVSSTMHPIPVPGPRSVNRSQPYPWTGGVLRDSVAF